MSVPGAVSVALCAQSAAVCATVGDDVARSPVDPVAPVEPALVLSLEPHATAMKAIATSPTKNFRITKPPRLQTSDAGPQTSRPEARSLAQRPTSAVPS